MSARIDRDHTVKLRRERLDLSAHEGDRAQSRMQHDDRRPILELTAAARRLEHLQRQRGIRVLPCLVERTLHPLGIRGVSLLDEAFVQAE
jgi:hypothetical protein